MSSNFATEMDDLLSDLNGGALFIQSEHARVKGNLLRIQADPVVNLEEATPGTDFSILTPTQCYEFAVLPPDLGIIDLTEEMPYNSNPNHAAFLRYLPGYHDWPARTKLTGLSIHHTMSHSPRNTAKYITNPVPQGKGYPRTQYHYWVSQYTGCPIYLCLPETYAPWHDHCGVSPNLSIGMAGSLHLSRPPEEQLWRTVQLVAHLLDKHSLSVDDVAGHNDRAGYPKTTVCPGWYADTPTDVGSGVWKRDFCIALQCCVDGKEWGGY